MHRRPLQFAIYKGVSGKFGAVQFNFQPPHYYGLSNGAFAGHKDFRGNRALDVDGRVKDGWRQREGAIFVEAATTIGKNTYDWEGKTTFACSITDMGKIVLFLSVPGVNLDIMHDPGAKTDREGQVRKHLKAFSKDGPLKGGCMLTVSESSGSNNKEHKIPLSADECITLRQLLLRAMPRALDW